ncbi:hypothetical protein PAXRUDRAFT_167382, partial [Paxillus rubicundulus Ve08.2h10]
KIHRTHPFHRVEQWTGTHFQESVLRLAGLTLHLGHDGGVCPSRVREVPQEVPDEEWEPSKPGARPPHLWVPDTPGYLVVVNISGVHYCNLAYCNCPGSPDPHIQLPCAGLFPASTAFPCTVFTFKVLDNFLRDDVECGTAAMNYFSKLKRITSNVFPHLVPVRSLVGYVTCLESDGGVGLVQRAPLDGQYLESFQAFEMEWVWA